MTPQSGTWTATGPMVEGRIEHTATLLSSGLVLVAGGTDASETPLVSAELYDPATRTWTATGDMLVARVLHTTNRLADDTVLAVGGMNAAAGHSAELFDPDSGSWTATDAPAAPRQVHTATTLADGRVLVTGGGGGGDRLESAEIYDPATQAWTSAGKHDTGASRTARGRASDERIGAGDRRRRRQRRVASSDSGGVRPDQRHLDLEQHGPLARFPNCRGHDRWSCARGRRLYA